TPHRERRNAGHECARDGAYQRASAMSNLRRHPFLVVENYVHEARCFYDSLERPPDPMRSFEIFDLPEPENAVPSDPGSVVRRMRKKGAREVLDVFIEGANVTARPSDAQ